MQVKTSSAPMITTKHGGKFKRRFSFKNLLLKIGIVIASFILIGVFLMYGPIEYFRDVWITTAMSTNDHQWLAYMLFDKKTIQSIMGKEVIKVPNENTDPSLVTVPDVSKMPKDNATELPKSPSDGEHIINGIGFIKLRNNAIKGDSYDGWLIKVYNPARLTIGLAQNFGSKGELLSHMVIRLGAFVGVNAGAFVDPNGHGNGGTPMGVFICDGKTYSGIEDNGSYPIIGFDNENKMILGSYNRTQLSSQHLKYGIQFSPFLIVNGKNSDVSGYSIQPRTAIGQTKDGTILLLAIDGRTLLSPGATMEDVQNIMIKYGAVNAANTDGGSSTVFVFKGKVINTPSGGGGGQERYLPNGFIISK